MSHSAIAPQLSFLCIYYDFVYLHITYNQFEYYYLIFSQTQKEKKSIQFSYAVQLNFCLNQFGKQFHYIH